MTEIETMMKELGCKGAYISSKQINSLIEDVYFLKETIFDSTFMYCFLKMKGGFIQVGTPSVCISESNFRDEIGKKISFENSFDELYKLEAYRTLASDND